MNEYQQIIEKLGQKVFDRLSEEYYPPSDSYEFYDSLENVYYNKGGSRLRDPSEYDSTSEGYTPFGDE
jgi:hypothetical protein